MAKIIADCTAVLLCGGKSSRMGFDKALLKIQGQYVILQTAEKLMELLRRLENAQSFKISILERGH